MEPACNGEDRPGTRTTTLVIVRERHLNVRRGHYELAVEEPTNRRLAGAFHELAVTI